MKKVIKKSLQSLLLVPVLALGVSAVTPVLQPATVLAQSSQIKDGVTATGDQDTQTANLDDVIKTVVNTLLFIIGAVSVIMIIFGGFKYITSSGDSSNVTSAKNTILYAVIGLIVALLSYAIVNWVIDKLVA